MQVSIRKWRYADAVSLASSLSSKKVLDHLRDGLPYPYTEKDALDYIASVLASDPNDTFAYAIDVNGTAVAVSRPSGRGIFTVVLRNWDIIWQKNTGGKEL